jgi:hypothetical protein
MFIAGTYKTQHGRLVITQIEEKITATFTKSGECIGTLSGNKVQGVWKNNTSHGIFEWTFDSEGAFSGKYKNGDEKGPMRGKWSGKRVTESSSGGNNRAKVEIIFKGRISKYFFGKVKGSFQDELQVIFSFADKSIIAEQDFLRLLLSTTLEDKNAAKENFKRLIPLAELERKCPNLFSLYEKILHYNLNHFELYDALFDTATSWSGGTGFITFFEDDCSIQIILDGIQVINNLKLEDFALPTKNFYSDDTLVEESEKKLSAALKRFIDQNSTDFGLAEDLRLDINKEGVLFCDTWFSPKPFQDLCTRRFNVTILHDDIIEYSYYLEVEDFSFDKILFLSHSNHRDFRGTSLSTKANYMFYDGKIILPHENWYRDKGITLEYEPEYTNLDFFLNG